MTSPAVAESPAPDINWNNLWWIAILLVVLIVAIRVENFWFLNFIHVFAGLLWTGIDLFMGFVIGPIMRSLGAEARRAMIVRLMPRMLFIMPTVSIVTTMAGWFLAVQAGYIDLPYPQLWWVIGALAIVTILTVQGLGLLLPTNIRVYLEMRSDHPDMDKVSRLMRIYMFVIASQGIMQLAIIVIMTRFASGL